MRVTYVRLRLAEMQQSKIRQLFSACIVQADSKGGCQVPNLDERECDEKDK